MSVRFLAGDPPRTWQEAIIADQVERALEIVHTLRQDGTGRWAEVAEFHARNGVGATVLARQFAHILQDCSTGTYQPTTGLTRGRRRRPPGIDTQVTSTGENQVTVYARISGPAPDEPHGSP